jgi:signal transduction histidine kinase
MTSALAHELNQPITALLAYGRACKELLDRGETGDVLKGAIEKMIVESGRASDVVRRLRDFFRSGAMQLEVMEIDVIVSSIVQQFSAKFEEHGVELNIVPVPGVSLVPARIVWTRFCNSSRLSQGISLTSFKG